MDFPTEIILNMFAFQVSRVNAKFRTDITEKFHEKPVPTLGGFERRAFHFGCMEVVVICAQLIDYKSPFVAVPLHSD